jgi:hypothetical protein
MFYLFISVIYLILIKYVTVLMALSYHLTDIPKYGREGRNMWERLNNKSIYD